MAIAGSAVIASSAARSDRSIRMDLNQLPYFPYPRDPTTRFGFIIGDLIALGVVVLLVAAIFPTLLRY
jgi:hypothetical protein